MPTIDQLGPATAVSDTDESLVSQNGVARKVTIGQIHAGLQPQLAVASGTLLGRSSPGIGGPENLTVGANLVLSGGTLSATPPPLAIDPLTQASAINATDELALSQAGVLAKATVAQVIGGLQPAIAVASGKLLGRQSVGTGGPEPITVGANLTLASGVLSATAATFTVTPLPAATVVNTTDLLPVSQSGSLVKASVSQVLAGLQPQIAVGSGNLLGRKSAGTGGPETIAVGSNLTLSNGILSAVPTPLSIAPLPAATTINSTDAVPLNQNGTVTKATVAQITAGLQPQLAVSSGTLLGRQSTGIGSPEQIAIGANLSLAGGTLSAAMPTPFSIAALPPASASNNTDLLPTSQSGVAASVSRAQLLAGTQAQITTTSGSLLGRQSAGVGGPETITIGANLTLSGGTLSAVAVPFNLATLSAASPPSLSDQVIVGQTGATKASTYAQFMSGLPLIGGLDLSLMVAKGVGATTARSFAARSADSLNVRDYGATLNGVADDTSAFQLVRNAAVNSGVITVPTGKILRTSDPSGVTGNVLWQLNGSTYPDGVTPIIGIGNDVVETFTGGRKLFSRQTSTTNDYAVLQTSYVCNHGGGTSGTTNNNMLVSTTVTDVPIAESIYGFSSSLTSSSGGGGSEGHVAVAGYSIRAAVPANVVGDTIWGMNIFAQSNTGLASNLDGSLVGAEIDVYANGDDPGPVYHRVGVQVTVGQANAALAPCVAQVGISVSANGSQNYWKQGVAVQSSYVTAFDASVGTQLPGGAAFRMGAGQVLALDAAGTYTLGYTVANGVQLAHSGTALLTMDSIGDAVFNGTVAANAGIGFRMYAGQRFALDSSLIHTIGWDSTNLLNYKVNGTPVFSVTDIGAVKVGVNQVVGARQTGWGVCAGPLSRAGLTTGSASLSQVAATLGALINDLITHGLIGA